MNRRELLSKKGLIGPSIGTLLSALGKRTKPDNADQTVEPEKKKVKINGEFEAGQTLGHQNKKPRL